MDYQHVAHRSRLSHPVLILLISVTSGLLLAVVWIDLTWQAATAAAQARDLRATELQGKVVQLDEVLTMSALMAATSGDERWERRYHEHAPLLAAAIEETLQIAPSEGVSAAAQTNEANEELLALEHQAFALVHEGRIEDAQAVLTSPAYRSQKHRYAAGLTALDGALQASIAQSNVELHHIGQRRCALNLGVFVVVVIGWSLFLRMLLKSEKQLVDHHGQLQQLAAELAHANRTLEQRAEELAHSNADLAESNLHLSTEIETRIHAQAAEKELHGKLLAATRQASMAEIATGVLHNVGNALTSVNVAATLSRDLIKHSRLADLTRATDLIAENAADLAGFFSTHPRGQLTLPYLQQLAENLQDEQSALLASLEDLCRKVDHTKQIVKAQQTYAKVADLDMDFDVVTVTEDVLKTLGSNLEEHGIELIRDWHEVPLICSDKHKVMQILANLVTNAIHALLSTNYALKRLTVRVTADGGNRVLIEVADTGIGIDPTHLTKIFQYGFTTKQTGHGFGLHHSALVARELGGELRVHSEGVGRGARFTLELPVAREAEMLERELVGV